MAGKICTWNGKMKLTAVIFLNINESVNPLRTLILISNLIHIAALLLQLPVYQSLVSGSSCLAMEVMMWWVKGLKGPCVCTYHPAIKNATGQATNINPKNQIIPHSTQVPLQAIVWKVKYHVQRSCLYASTETDLFDTWSAEGPNGDTLDYKFRIPCIRKTFAR